MTLLMSGFMVAEVPLVEGHFLDMAVVLPSVRSPRSCCQENRGLCTCPARVLQPSDGSRITVLYGKTLKGKTLVLYFSLCYYLCSFTCLINYALFALLKLSGFWVLCFPKVFSFCTALGDFVWYMTLSAIYGGLIYCLTLSNLANLFMYFVLLRTTFPP